MHVSSQPYLKTYLFPFWSLGTFLRIGILVLAVILPFFLTYSTPSTLMPYWIDFFMSSHLQTSEQSISYSYQYHVSISTSSGVYSFTNLYQNPTENPPILSVYWKIQKQSIEKSVMEFWVEWVHPPNERVKSVEVDLFYSYFFDGVSHFGSTQAKAEGYSLAEVSIAGPLNVVKGLGESPLTESCMHFLHEALALLGYDLASFSEKTQSSSAYLKYDYSVLPVNLPADQLKVKLVLNFGGLLKVQGTPSILGQLVWSWIQYFPIFLTLFWGLNKIFSFVVRERIIKRKVIHDPQYLKLAEQETQKRSRLRMA